MKKVGIMTLHIGDNYGALLQCYALRYMLNSFPDIQAEVINFDPGREFPVYEDKKIQKQYIEKLKKFKEFNRTYNGVSGSAFCDIYVSEAMKYEYYIVGSDQVWNTSFIFANEAYFLNFVPPNAKRIAYAPSIGLPVTSPKLKREWFEKNIPQFDFLSLREMSHERFLKEFTDKKIYSVVDPTLLLECSDYDELCNGTHYPEGDYLVLYFLKHDNSAPLLMEFANMMSRKFNLKVIYSFATVLPQSFKNVSETFYYSDPREFVQLIKHAKVVVTNSFHGTIFSIKYHVPFFVFIVSSMAARITDLLKNTGLESQIVYGYKKLSDDMLQIDFSKADKVLEKKREGSVKYLKMALNLEGAQ